MACHLRCLRSALSPVPLDLTFPSVAVDLAAVPQVYHDLEEVFFKKQAIALPPHHPYDNANDLRLGAPLPSSWLNQLSRPEHDAMESYISESLAFGLIVPSSYLVEAGFFFVKKRMAPLPVH